MRGNEKTNAKDNRFRSYLNKKLQNPEFKQGFEEHTLKLDLAIKIIKLRKERNLTQQEFAELMGTTQEAISRIESGDYDGYTLKTLKKIADATDTELSIDFRRKSLEKQEEKEKESVLR